MSQEQTNVLSDLEKEAAYSWREWPVYVVMRLKRLHAIQQQLRIGGGTESAMLRRDELLKAIYDMDEIEGESPADSPSPPASAVPPAPPSPPEPLPDADVSDDDASDDDYLEDIVYED